MDLKNKRAFIYYRVSSDDQIKNNSLSDQLIRLTEFCDRNHMVITGSFQDDASALSFKRPQWQQLLSLVRSRKNIPDYILFTNWSRFSRAENLGESFMMIDLLRRHGSEPQAIEQWIDYDIPESAFLLSMYITSPSVDNRRRASNTVNGTRRALKDGRWCNKAPFGYDNWSDENKKPLIRINPEKASIVADIFNKYLDGADPKVIIRNARDKGLKHYGHGSFARIITNPLYGGMVRVFAYKGEDEAIVKGLHEAIVTEDVWYAANAKLKGLTAPRSKVYDDAMPMRGIVHCNKCGGLLTGGRSRGKYRHYWYYRCLTCNGENYSMKKSDEQLKSILSAISLHKHQIDFFVSEVDKEMKVIIKEKMAESHTLKRDIAKLQQQINSLEEKYIGNSLNFETYEKYYPAYRSDLAIKQLRLDEISIDKGKVIELYREALPRMQNLGFLYEKLDLHSKQELLELIFVGGLFKTKSGYRTPELNPLFDVKAAVGAGLSVAKNSRNLHKFIKAADSRPSEKQIKLLQFVLRIAA